MKFQSGSALFLVLLAIGLFAALTYAVTQTGRGARNIDPEKAALAAASLMQFAADIEAGFARSKLVGKYDWSEISYGGTNTDCDTDKCDLFAAGRGVAPDLDDVPKEAIGNDTSKNAQTRFIRVDGLGSDDPEVAIVVYGIPHAICKAVNDAVGIETSNTLGLPHGSVDNSGNQYLYTGTYSSDDLRNTTVSSNAFNFRWDHVGVSGQSEEVYGQKTFCFCRWNSVDGCNETQQYYTRFWHILEVR